MESIEYNLSLINNIDVRSCLKDNDFEKLKLVHKQWMKNDKVYHILKYDKKILAEDLIDSIGLLRSVIYSNEKINAFSPPKSLNNTVFLNKYAPEECIAEEFVEGTMINVFYDRDVDKWEIASKTSVGGNIKYFRDQPTFSELFEEICNELKINFDNFNKDYCYSFVMQHPKNKFVIPICVKKLYLIAIYKIDNETLKVTEIPRDTQISELENIEMPQRSPIKSFTDMIDAYGSMNTNINIMGAVIYHKSGIRTKIRNPNYEYLRSLRGNSTKLQYQYLCLRKVNQVKNYLTFFSESKEQFSIFRLQIHIFTDNLYTNYIKCYIKKEKPLIEFPKQFRTHMYSLHQHYLEIRAEKGYINRQKVINYINELEPAKLMYSLNYGLRSLGQEEKETPKESIEESNDMNLN